MSPQDKILKDKIKNSKDEKADPNRQDTKEWQDAVNRLNELADKYDKGYILGVAPLRDKKNKEFKTCPTVMRNLDEGELGGELSLLLTKISDDAKMDDLRRNEFLDALVNTVNTASVIFDLESDEESSQRIRNNCDIRLQLAINELRKNMGQGKDYRLGYLFMTYPKTSELDESCNGMSDLCIASDLDEESDFMSAIVLAILHKCKHDNLDVEQVADKLHNALMMNSVDDLIKDEKVNRLGEEYDKD